MSQLFFEDPFLLQPRFIPFEGKTAILTALPYGRGERAVPSGKEPVGALGAFAQKNYYRELVIRLRREIRRLSVPGAPAGRDIRIFCNSRLPEKKLAEEAGLGVIGKNSLLLIPGKGSTFILGGLLLLGEKVPPFEASSSRREEAFSLCGKCELCIEACPTGAIVSPGKVDRRRCLQGLASEPGRVPKDIIAKWGILLYGCDICMNACPWNSAPPQAADCGLGELGAGVPIGKILPVPEPELKKEVFRGTVLDRSWISPFALKRNALIAAAHQEAEGLEKMLLPYRDHPEEGLRETAEGILKLT